MAYRSICDSVFDPPFWHSPIERVPGPPDDPLPDPYAALARLRRRHDILLRIVVVETAALGLGLYALAAAWSAS